MHLPSAAMGLEEAQTTTAQCPKGMTIKLTREDVPHELRPTDWDHAQSVNSLAASLVFRLARAPLHISLSQTASRVQPQ